MTSHISSQHEAHPHRKHPVLFEEFFDLGLDETASPFLTPESRDLGRNISLKAGLFAAGLLVISFLLSLHPTTVPLSYLTMIAVYVLVGIPSLIDAIDDLMSLDVNIDVLMTLAAFSSVVIGSGLEGALLLVLFALSHAMEDAVTAKAKNAINSLHKITPTTACVIKEDGTLIARSVKDIVKGTRILVRAGQVVPLDGRITEGTSSVNLVHLTGENLPVTKAPGDQVPSGGLNLEGAITIEVTHTCVDSTLAKIIQLVTQAQDARPQLQRWFDKMSRSYAITIISLFFFFAATMPLFLNIAYLGIEGSIYRALAFLIAASPCALILAIPIAYLSAISVCAKNGILLKGGITLDALANCHAIAFDKTGTLTTGLLKLQKITPLEDNSAPPEEIFGYALAMERNAIHPIAKAILSYGEEKAISRKTITDFKSVPGYGLEAKTEEGKTLFIGHAEFIASKLPKTTADKLIEEIDKIKLTGLLVAVLIVGRDVYLFQFEDMPRPKIRRTLKALRDKYHLDLVMLTGDHAVSATRVAKDLGLTEFYADLRPEDKLNYVGKLAEKKGLAMVGDGINDAPALARATVGIGMGQVGSTTAIEASDVVLLQDNIELLDWLMGKAHQTRAIVKQNLFIATAAILIASLPALAGIVPLWLAVILHEGGTIVVGLNALRLLRK
ncbi:MAG: cation-translocating P-type ATPase [Chlamydiia bacterium]|nr:cation-translocating P-type ATPase [Chlamydiia bacterium]